MEHFTNQAKKIQSQAKALRLKAKPGSRFEPEVASLIEKLADLLVYVGTEMDDEGSSSETNIVSLDYSVVASTHPDDDPPKIVIITDEMEKSVNTIKDALAFEDGSEGTILLFAQNVETGEPDLDNQLIAGDPVQNGDFIWVRSENEEEEVFYVIEFQPET